jgi:hypothetical protein
MVVPACSFESRGEEFLSQMRVLRQQTRRKARKRSGTGVTKLYKLAPRLLFLEPMLKNWTVACKKDKCILPLEVDRKIRQNCVSLLRLGQIASFR